MNTPPDPAAPDDGALTVTLLEPVSRRRVMWSNHPGNCRRPVHDLHFLLYLLRIIPARSTLLFVIEGEEAGTRYAQIVRDGEVYLTDTGHVGGPGMWSLGRVGGGSGIVQLSAPGLTGDPYCYERNALARVESAACIAAWMYDGNYPSGFTAEPCIMGPWRTQS